MPIFTKNMEISLKKGEKGEAYRTMGSTYGQPEWQA
jgi:hypothetical protein